ncbi:cellulose biosynthesis protein BcsS [Pulveribacter suum]|uniref:Cellulose biosynthesis protein BcsS n=1 Tax=Pulveribacter suum TaxID=2116657 RepID=A0A2P1NN71_9BURK|nr:cellulose biosynthesis protein BcsS [Pulveribacter suum]AVP58501.1 hypothetical protein C7H73_13060 [Pulveribacter suum]
MPARHPYRVNLALPLGLCLAAAAALPLPALADGLWLSGAEASRGASYLYVGRIASLEHEQLQNGWATRLWLDRASYTYWASGQRYRGRSVGLEAGVGYLFGQAPFTGSVFLNLMARDTHLSPSDPGSAVSGFHLRPKVSSDLNWQFSPEWGANAGMSYTPLGNAWWARARLLHGSQGGLQWGLEHARHGDDSYRARQTGVVLTGVPAGPARWAFKAGVRQMRGESSSPYVGVDLSWTF